MGTEPIERQTIASLRLIWPDETPRYGRRRTDQPQAPGKPGLPSQPRTQGVVAAMPLPNSRRRGHLFVLDGGKE
jgi:hypothetical protein